MKKINFLIASGFIFYLFLTACEFANNNDLNDSEFRISFSDGSEISESDILFYDTATHFLFLKKNLDFDNSISRFSIMVNEDTIYTGIRYSCFLSSPPREVFFISDCFFYGHSVVELGYYPYATDLRNDQRILNALKYDNLLRYGLTCKIDSIKVKSFDDYSEVICTITITNHDRVSYYIPDPVKMGELDFNYYTGGLSFQNMVTHKTSFLKWSVSNPDFGNIQMSDFSILKGNSKVSYTFKSSDYYKMEKGFYNTMFRFSGLHDNTGESDLTRDKGRIWVGEAVGELDRVFVE